MSDSQVNSNSVGRRFKRCILHIGTEKTGTTAIQEYLNANRKVLRKTADTLYSQSAGGVFSSQLEFVAAISDEVWKSDVGRAFGLTNDADQTEFRDKLAADLDKELARARRCDTLLISCEHFHSRIRTPELISKLKSFLERWAETFEIVVYFRRQDQVALAFQSTRLKSSVNLGASDIYHVLKTTAHYFAYDQMYKNWAAVFGENAMRARLYEPGQWYRGNLIDDFLNACRLPPAVEASSFVNRSLNRRGFHFLQALNRKFPNKPGDNTDEARQKLVEFIANTYPGQYFSISRDEAKKICADFEDVNERLRRLAFPDHASPLFSDDFSEYPETAEPAEPDYDDAVDVAMALWRETWRPSPLRLRRKMRYLRWFSNR